MSRFQQQSPFDRSAQDPWASGALPVSAADAETRGDFIRKTYLHVAGAAVAMVLLLTGYFTLTTQDQQLAVVQSMLGSRWSWLIVLGLYMGASWLANAWAAIPGSKGKQYAGLGLYIVAISVILVPALTIAREVPQFAGVIPQAAVITLVVFGALTAFVMVTGANFNFLGGILSILGGIAFAAILAGIIFGFSMGLWIIIPMIGLLCGMILYQTSQVMHDYPVGAHVAAALGLFASLATLFYYVLSLLMRMRE